MKTSNKILLGILLISFGYLACAQLALHVKYAKQDFTNPGKYNAFFYNEYKFGNIKHVRIRGLAECQVISSDSVKLSVEKSSLNYIKFNISGDTLFIYGEYPADRSADYKLNRSPQNINLYLPSNSDIYAFNSNINVKGNRIPGNQRSYHFDLTGCNLFTRYRYGMDSLDRYFDTLIVNARKNSQVILFHNDHFKTLDIRLDHSLINDFHAKIERANIVTDSSSVLVIGGGNISKLNTTAIKK